MTGERGTLIPKCTSHPQFLGTQVLLAYGKEQIGIVITHFLNTLFIKTLALESADIAGAHDAEAFCESCFRRSQLSSHRQADPSVLPWRLEHARQQMASISRRPERIQFLKEVLTSKRVEQIPITNHLSPLHTLPVALDPEDRPGKRGR